MNRANIGAAKIAGVAGAILLLTSCLKTEKFPAEPSIAMKSIGRTGDSLMVTITFTDGDGDIGLDETYDQPPFDSGSEYYHNLFYDPERLVNGAWVPTDQPYYYRVKVLTPSGQNKALEGELAIAFRTGVFPLPPLLAGDTARFRIRLLDRALHESNELITEPIPL